MLYPVTFLILRSSLFLVISFLLLIPLSASAYTVSSVDVNSTVVEGESLGYKLLITNDKLLNDTVWFFDFIDTRLFTPRYSPSRVNLELGENVTIDFFID